MLPRVALVLACGLACNGLAPAADETWELRGRFESLKPGDPAVAIFRLDDDRRIELPLDALSEGSRAAALRAAAARPAMPDDAGGVGPVTVPGPWGRAVTVPVPESIKAVEADAIWCRTAAEAADVYRLFLADAGISAAQRSAADARLRDWAAMAEKSLVRFGDRWVPPAEARAAAAEADEVVEHALEVMRLGNADLAEKELQKADRIDPESGRARFLMGLSYALAAGNPAKAADLFAGVVSREPDNAAALSNLAVLLVLARRFAGVGDHFRRAAELSPDPAFVCENVAWAMTHGEVPNVIPGRAKARMPEKTRKDLNDLYRILIQDLKLPPPPGSVSAPRYVFPDWGVCNATTIADIAKSFEACGSRPVGLRRAVGFVVAPDHVLCPRSLLLAADGSVLDSLAVILPVEQGRRLPATVIAAPASSGIAILRCEGLSLQPLPLAAQFGDLPEIVAIDRQGESWLGVRPVEVRGRLLGRASNGPAGPRFVHTAVTAWGLGGGPILNSSGQVVGMLDATPRMAASGKKTGFGIPIDHFREALEDRIGDHVAHKAAAPQAATAVVFVTAQLRPEQPAP